MAKVITFSTKFPSYHPRAGQPTYFIENIYKTLFLMKVVPSGLVANFSFDVMNNKNYKPKCHTIRKGNRFKKGDFFSPRVWGTDVNPKSGKSGPYHSKQIILSQDIEIKNVWDIEIDKEGLVRIGNEFSFLSFGKETILAENDGLNHDDFFNWFSKLPFKGQIICWNDSVNY